MMPLVAGAAALVLAVGVAAPVAGVGVPFAGPDGPTDLLRAVAIPEHGQVLAVEAVSWAAGDQATWMLDLRSRRWQRRAPGLPTAAGIALLAHVPGRADVLAVPRSPGAVWSLDLDTGSWQARPVPRTRPVDVTDIAVDVRRAVVLAWSDVYDELWSYDPSVNRWSPVRRTAPWPRLALPRDQAAYTLMTYDAAVDRVVLAVLPLPGRPGSTWLFDPGSRRWARQASTPPPLVLGYGEWGTEAVFDAVHRRVVLFSRGVVATYEASLDRWTVPSSASWPGLVLGPDPGLASVDGVNPWPRGQPLGPLSRADHQLVADPGTGRVLVLGGSALYRVVGSTDPWDLAWRPVTDLWAYDVGANSWTLLAEGQR